jgi:photosystem II stability/assembly factor-like uncharacterized protein
MLRACLTAFVLTFCVSAVVWGGEEVIVLRVEKPVSTEALASLGLVFLADVGEAYLVEGDANSHVKLARAGVGFSRILSAEPGLEVFLLKQRGIGEGIVHTAALSRVAPGTYLTAIRPRDVADLDRLPYAKARLVPGPYPERVAEVPFRAGVPVSANPVIEEMVSRVSGDSIWCYISELSGMEPVGTPYGPDTLHTRYSLSERFSVATGHVADRLQRYCSDVASDNYVVGTTAFYSASFPDTLNGWVVGNAPAVYRTRDGGLSWERQPIDAPYHSFWGVCATGGARGWICGAGGSIYGTVDGGETWSPQTSQARVTLNEICFLDSLIGWVVGDGGLIMRTTDGGAAWTEVESGTTCDLYGVDFRSAARGWACGEDGCTLFWDGTGWRAGPAGTGEDLMDIAFADDYSGWAVGSGWMVLKTEDAGETWAAQEVPGDVNPFLKGVSALSSTSALVAGLNGTILRTGDGGRTWTVQATGTLFGLRRIRFVDTLKGWAVGYGSTVLHTTDGGLSWESRKENLPDEALIRLENVVGTKRGTKGERQVIICGHFDSISEDPDNRAPGADDNATGTAAVLEAARILRDCNFERTIKFICFSGEEQGLFGSGDYAADASRDGDLIAGVLNFDMIGYVDAQPEDIDLIGNEASEWLVDVTADCAAIYVPSLEVKKLIDPTMVLSDHAPFWKAGYYALLGIEDRDLQYPFYHTTGDTLGNLNRAFTADVVRMAVGTVAHLAKPDTAASGPGSPLDLRIKTALPNPFRSAVEITFVPAEYGDARASIVDVTGRRVKTLESTWIPGNGHVAIWHGRNEREERVAAGIYFVVLEQGEHRAASKIVLLR